MLNSKHQGKTLTIDYNKTIVQLSKDSFKLPETKNASENFTIKTLQNQNFSLRPKIGEESFTKRDFSATKNIVYPTEAQITIEELTPDGDFPNDPIYSLTIFNNIFYLFPFQDRKYYSSSDGQTWKDEGNVHADFEAFQANPLSIVYKNKLYLIQPSTDKLLFSTPIPNSGTALNFTKGATLGATIRGAIDGNMVVFQDKITLRNPNALYTLNSTTLNLEKKLDFTGNQILTSFEPLVFKDKLWTFGGLDFPTSKKLVFSSDGKSVTQEESLPTTLYNSGARVFANGILLIGGKISTTTNSNDLYWSPDGKDFKSVKTYNNLSGIIAKSSVLKSENQIWVAKRTGGNPRVYKITFDPTK